MTATPPAVPKLYGLMAEFEDVADHCTVCHKCESPCPVKIDFGDVSMNMRNLLNKLGKKSVRPAALAQQFMIGTTNPHNVIKATFDALKRLKNKEDVAALRGSAPERLLEQLREALFSHDYRQATAAVAAYGAIEADPEALIGMLTAVACTDDGTLLHNFKHLHAMVDGFRGCAGSLAV